MGAQIVGDSSRNRKKDVNKTEAKRLTTIMFELQVLENLI